MAYLDMVKQDKGLFVGQHVTVNWTSGGRYWSGNGRIVKLNAASVKVALSEHVGKAYHGGWPAGHRITVPRAVFKTSAIARWSPNNCVTPIEEDPT